MSSTDELFATKYVDLPDGTVSHAAQQAMARELGADSLRYLPVEAIARAVTLSPERLCRACITGKYPTETGQQLYQIETGSFTRSEGKRAFEPLSLGTS
jgi:amidophosphoribosyltransferase